MLNKRNIWVFILMILMLANCAKVPVTGRPQLSIVKNSELIPMSFNQYDGVLEKSNLSKDQEQVAKIKKVVLVFSRLLKSIYQNKDKGMY